MFSGREEWRLGRERVLLWGKWEERGGREKIRENYPKGWVRKNNDYKDSLF